MLDCKISVIIPTCNRAAILQRCLDALVAQTLPRNNFEVVVCDDGSKDHTADILASFAKQLNLTSLRQENRGPAAARNRAIAAAQGKLLVIINDDSILAPDALERHDQLAAPQTITLGTFRTPAIYKADFFTALVDSTGWIFPFVGMKQAGIKNFDLFITCNLCVPKQAILDVGGFDETFPFPAGEDMELGYRLSQAGYRIYFDPDIICHHDSYFTPASFVRLRAMRGVEDLRFLHKHRALIGHYQQNCMAMARRWYARIKQNPDSLNHEVAIRQSKMEHIVASYATNKATGQETANYRLIEQALPLLDQIGFMAYVAGMARSDYFDTLVGAQAIPPLVRNLGMGTVDLLQPYQQHAA
jgi:GT2 family glycosyltransferase